MPFLSRMSPLHTLALLCLLLGTSLARASEILVAAQHDSPALQQFVSQLAARHPAEPVRLVHTPQLGRPSTLPADSRLILLGAEALDWRLSDPHGPPTLILQISRVQAQQRLGDRRPDGITLLWSDPPAGRQLQLIRQLLPRARRVGLLYSDASRFLVNEIRQQAAQQKLAVNAWYWPDTVDNRPLIRMLEESDVLLGIDDPALYNPNTIKGVLLASYNHKLALIGPTAAFIRAGSLSSSYSDQQDWLETLTQLLAQPPQRWPREAYPQYFKVLSNPQVARSLGVDLGNAETLPPAEEAR